MHLSMLLHMVFLGKLSLTNVAGEFLLTLVNRLEVPLEGKP